MIKNNIKKIIITTIFLTLSNCSALTENSNNGCTDQSACNYNVNAEIDDGSCLIASGCDSCTVDSNNEQYTNGSGTLIDGDRDDDSTCDNSDLIDFTYNIDESLPTDWITEFHVIMSNLTTLIPAYQNYFPSLTIYTWNDNITDPFEGIQGGAYISNQNDLPIMVMEIPNTEFTYNSYHRYSVIAHEYFHVYQRSISAAMNYSNGHPSGIDIKWLIEGAAASFESIYIRNHYNYEYFNQQDYVDSYVLTDPSIFESHDSNDKDTNYSTSVFMALVLIKELMKQNIAEEDAFKLLYKTFMESGATNEDWEEKFESIFNISITNFYETVKTYTADINEVLPSNSLTLAQIFD